MSAQAQSAAAALDTDTGWTAIRQVFDLTEQETDLLAVLLAVELDPGLGRVVAYLHDDGRLTQPTAWLSARLAGREPTPFAGAALLRWQLAAPLEGMAAQRLTTPWQADPAVALSVFSGFWHDPAIADGVRIIEPEQVAALPVLHEKARDALAGLADLRDAELVGPPGIGRKTVAAQFAAGAGRVLLAADLPALVAAGSALNGATGGGGGIATAMSHGAHAGLTPGQAVTRVLRQAAITGALAYIGDADTASEADWTRARLLGVPYIRGVRHPTGQGTAIALAPLTISARLHVWRQATEAPPPEALLSHRLTPAEITRAAASRQGIDLKPRSKRPDNALLTRLSCPYTWDDLVLPADVVTQLRAFETQVRLRWTVYEDWGFSRLTHLGHGISALFGGPSGTGKTMAAQVMARSLGIDLLRVDLAGVVNKYIGETEKKLREVFDACEDSGALLFFDEADALFGTRTQVKDAHDRFANIEIDYLLQRIEQFDGVAILATNRRQDWTPRSCAGCASSSSSCRRGRRIGWRCGSARCCRRRRTGSNPGRDRLAVSVRAADHDRGRDQGHRAGCRVHRAGRGRPHRHAPHHGRGAARDGQSRARSCGCRCRRRAHERRGATRAPPPPVRRVGTAARGADRPAGAGHPRAGPGPCARAGAWHC